MITNFDIAIIGGGIIGLATAWKISVAQPRLHIVVLEKENEIGMHQTGHNSGVIHSGIYYKPGSLKAKNCINGYQQLIAFCDKHDIIYDLCVKVIVATHKDQCPQLDTILASGLANGLKGIKKISAAATREIEPHVNVVEAIHVPQAGIIHYLDVAKKYAALFKARGGNLWTAHKVIDIKKRTQSINIVTTKKEIEAKLVINCAGLYSDKIAGLTGQKINHKILPFRGEYYELTKEKQQLVNHLIYPVPNPNFPFLGVHYTRMIKGGIEAGPNAVLAFKREGYSRWDMHPSELTETLAYSGFQKLALKYWRDGLGELHRSYSKKAFVKALQHLIPEIGMADLKRGGSGVRAMACASDGNLIDDYLILEAPHVINICNAPSPAATSSLAIGETIANLALKRF